MQRFALTFILGLFITLGTWAQEAPRTRFSFVLSPQISWLKSDHSAVNSNGSLFGYNFGVVMDRFFADNYALSTGLTINTTGGKLEYKDGVTMEIGGEQEPDIKGVTYRLKYIEVPFGLKLLTNEFNRSRYYGQFGLYSQFNIKTNDGNGKSMNKEVNFFDMGYHLGGGMEYSLGGDTYLMVGLLYNNGFLDITDNGDIDDNAHQNRFVIQFGIVF